MKQTLNRNLSIGFGVSLLLLLASSIASYVSINRLLTSSQWVTHTRVVIDLLNGVISPIKDAENAQRGYLLSGEEDFLGPYRNSFTDASSALERVQRQTIDNPVQQRNVSELKALMTKRFNLLDHFIQVRKEKGTIDLVAFREGRNYMDSVARRVQDMKDEEQRLLSLRKNQMDSFAGSTPALIVVVAIISLLSTIIFFNRVRRDITEKTRLQDSLELKDREISQRIHAIQAIAENVAAGNYGIRVNDEQKDTLGSLGGSLNRMAISLEEAFTLLSEKEWMQTGLAALNEAMVGEMTVEQLTKKVIEEISRYSGSQVGALYLGHPDNTLQFSAGYAFLPPVKSIWLRRGEGLVGECFAGGKEILVTDIPENSLQVSFATAEARPANIFLMPVRFERVGLAVIEIGSVIPYTPRVLHYLRQIAENIGVAINTAQNRSRMQELFEETQAQTEELQAQHNEMESINSEMEVQTEKLQASEEELKVQQEELMQTNSELEERTKLLEEKNQLVLDRNIEIQRKAEELEIATRYKSEFLANMSHELRTPLNSILLLSRLLAENGEHNLSKDQIEYAQVIRSSGNGLLELIDEILDLSKIESGKMQLEYATIQLNEVLGDVNSLFEPLSRDKKIDFRIEVAEGTPHQIETDKMRMEQVLKNLLSNAFKFTSKGGVTLRVEPAEGGKYIDFRVADTGIGIAKEKLDLIFDAFQQADGSTRRKFGGTGLGLSISRELSKLLMGDLRVSSEDGSGSEFTFRLPARRSVAPPPAAAPAERRVTENIPAPQLPRAGTIPQDVPDDRDSITAGDRVILIVEDDTPFAKALLNYTRQKNYKGVVAVRGDDGVELARRFNPVGILLDLQLPVKNGWEVMDELKADPATRHIPVHVMSSMEARKESISKGAADFISKPIAFEQMNDVFRKIEFVLARESNKVLIVEENPKHAEALGYFLGTYDLHFTVTHTIADSIKALSAAEANCVILDMGIADDTAYEKLESIRQVKGLEQLPIIVFTGKNISRTEEQRIRKFADSIVIKTAHSYQRILDEISLFLHVVEEKEVREPSRVFRKLGALDEVLKDKIVLVADDDVRNIYSLTKMLEKHKMKILPAIDGKEAVAMIGKNPGTSIVLMDMMMPEMDGFEAIRAIRKMPGVGRIPIIAVTAKAMAGDREKCIRQVHRIPVADLAV